MSVPTQKIQKLIHNHKAIFSSKFLCMRKTAGSVAFLLSAKISLVSV